MATITSDQTGPWTTTTTWVGGDVPNMTTDNVVIAAGHSVTLASAITVPSGRTITIEATGILYLSGAGRLYLHGGTLAIAGILNISGTGAIVELYGPTLMVSGGKIYIAGQAFLRFSRRELQPVVTGDHTVIDFGKVYGYSSGPIKIGA